MNDFGNTAPLHRALRLEEMVIAASTGLHAEDAAAQAVATQDVAADVQPALGETDPNAAAHDVSQQIDANAGIALEPSADADQSVDASLQASLQAIRDSLAPGAHSVGEAPSEEPAPQEAHPVHATGTQIMPVGDVAQSGHGSVAQNDLLALDLHDHGAPSLLSPLIASAPVGSLAEPIAHFAQAPFELLTAATAEAGSTLGTLTGTLEHVVGAAGGVVDAVATVPSLQGAGVDALAGLLGPGAGSASSGSIGGEVHAVFDHAVFSLPIGLDDAHQADNGMLHALHATLPHAGSGLI